MDDLIVYQLAPERFLVIVNAGNIEKDYEWVRYHLPTGVFLENASEHKFLFALQGPSSLPIVEAVFRCDFRSVRYYHFLCLKSSWGDVLISRTGYTGEDGVEIMGEAGVAGPIWEALLDTGKSAGLRPIGFGARDTLRLEAGMLLWGQDMEDSTSAVEAGLGWAVDFEKQNFLGRERNLREHERGSPRKLIGFEMVDRGIPRHGFSIEKGESAIGHVTSGTFSPTLRKSIGLGYVPAGEAGIGNVLEISIRGKKAKAKVVPLPFYKRNARTQ